MGESLELFEGINSYRGLEIIFRSEKNIEIVTGGGYIEKRRN
jgi:hypothetical protein